MNNSEMLRLIGAAESQGFKVWMLRKGMVVAFSIDGLRSDGTEVQLIAVVGMSTSFENAIDRLRQIGLMWLSPE